MQLIASFERFMDLITEVIRERKKKWNEAAESIL